MIATIPATALEYPQHAPIRYRNHFRWRILPPEGAREQGFLDKGFENKARALKYQKEVKRRFPKEPCCLIDTGRWYDSYGRPIH